MFTGNGLSQEEVLQSDKMSVIWVYVSCLFVPILLPAFFLTVANFLLIVGVDLKVRKNTRGKQVVKELYDPFAISTREMAIRIASGPGKIINVIIGGSYNVIKTSIFLYTCLSATVSNIGDPRI